ERTSLLAFIPVLYTRMYTLEQNHTPATPKPLSRRQVLKRAAAGTTLLLANQASAAAQGAIEIAGSEVEIKIASVSLNTFRLTISPVRNGLPLAVPMDGSLARTSWG